MQDSARKKFQHFNQTKGLNCLDKVDSEGKQINRKLYGSSDSMASRHLAIVLRPCVPIPVTDDNRHMEDEMCLANYT